MTDEHEANRRNWDRNAAAWRQLRDRDGICQRLPQEPELAFEGGVWEQIQRHLGALEGMNACLIGSGDNYAALALALAGANVTSVDISQKQLDVAAERAEKLGLSIEFIRADAAGLVGIESDTIDLVTSTNGFFVWISDLSGVFDSVQRVLKAGGHYAFYDIHPFVRPFSGPGPAMEMEKPYWSTGPFRDEEDDTYEYTWTLSDLLNSLLRSGLTLVEVAETGPRNSRFFEDLHTKKAVTSASSIGATTRWPAYRAGSPWSLASPKALGIPIEVSMPVENFALIRGNRRLLLVIGDLLWEPVDAIVNAANARLAHGGGVAAAISDASGGELDEEGRAYVLEHGPIPVGEAVATTAGKMDFKGVIHAVGPRLGDGDEEEKLTQAVSNALLRAHERGWQSLALPAISSGIFAVPLETCARAYIAGVHRHIDDHPDSTLEEIRFCLFLGPLVDLVAKEMDRPRLPTL